MAKERNAIRCARCGKSPVNGWTGGLASETRATCDIRLKFPHPKGALNRRPYQLPTKLHRQSMCGGVVRQSSTPAAAAAGVVCVRHVAVDKCDNVARLCRPFDRPLTEACTTQWRYFAGPSTIAGRWMMVVSPFSVVSQHHLLASSANEFWMQAGRQHHTLLVACFLGREAKFCATSLKNVSSNSRHSSLIMRLIDGIPGE